MTIVNKVVTITASAGAEDTVTAYVVPPAQKFRLSRVMFIFPAGTGGKLGLAVKWGVKQLVPDEGLARGDNVNYSLFDDTELGGSEILEVYYKNDDTTNDLTAFVIIEGELIRG